MKKRIPFGKLLHSSLSHVNCSALPWKCFSTSVWSIANNFPDLVSRLDAQLRLMGNCGLNGVTPRLSNTVGVHCFFCKESIKYVSHFFFDWSEFKDNFECVWAKLNLKSSSLILSQIGNFIDSLNRQQKILLLLGNFVSSLIKQLPLSLPDFYPLLFLKFTA